MAIHQNIQRLLLLGSTLPSVPEPPRPQPPEVLLPLVDSLAAAHDRFDRRATQFGDRYRSGFWAIYMLSAIAVLCAVLPLAIGWDSAGHGTRLVSGSFAVLEVAVIGILGAVYWWGHRRDWQGQWLHNRTIAELTGYLPLIAPLLDFSQPSDEPNWYSRILDPGQYLRATDAVSKLCAQHESLARQLLAQAWCDAAFVRSYTAWVIDVLQAQQHYHRRIAGRQHALMHRVHRVTGALFSLTAMGALLHLIVHTVWLSLATTFFPALAAGMHGALAQSEAYRLHTSSLRLAADLQGAIDRIRGAAVTSAAGNHHPPQLKAAIEAAIALILEEHQDWHMLVRPHHLPLA